MSAESPPEKSAQTTADQRAALPIGEVARRTGVAVATLRAWERRYGLLDPQRTEGGHRRYGSADLARVRRMQQLLADGWGADAAARQAREDALLAMDGVEDREPLDTSREFRVPSRPAEPAQPEAATARTDGNGRGPDPAPAPALPEGLTPAASAIARRLVDAIAAYDATAANEAIDDTFARFDVAAALDHVLMPTLRVVGEGWEHDPGAIAREHFATNAIRPRLIRLLRAPASRNAPSCVAAAPEKEEHDLGVLASAVVAADAGWHVTFLGARTPTGALRRAIEATGADAALVGSVRRRPAQTFLDELARALPCGLVLGGAGFREEDLHRVEGLVTRHLGAYSTLPASLHQVGQPN
jgi:methanogenic corrinoid protein MtbC1